MIEKQEGDENQWKKNDGYSFFLRMKIQIAL
jgi:hypothetical protein